MVDVFKYVALGETQPEGSIPLETAMAEIAETNYINPAQLEQLLTTLRAMPEGNEKFVFAVGLQELCVHTLGVIARFGIIEELGTDKEKGRRTKRSKQYRLTAKEEQILVEQYRSVYVPASEELSSLTYHGNGLK